MTATRRTSAVLIATFQLALPWVCAGETASFADLAGTYVSSVRGGCQLELDKGGYFSLTCAPWRRALKSRVMPLGDGRFVILGGEVRGDLQLPPDPPPARAGSGWPPSLRDPTKGPYVVHGPEATDTFVLMPLRWGERLYLIRAGELEPFCQSISSGLEPRKTAGGDQFLRRGDHAKRVGAKRPPECDALK
jgi:hypothetical protein